MMKGMKKLLFLITITIFSFGFLVNSAMAYLPEERGDFDGDGRVDPPATVLSYVRDSNGSMGTIEGKIDGTSGYRFEKESEESFGSGVRIIFEQTEPTKAEARNTSWYEIKKLTSLSGTDHTMRKLGNIDGRTSTLQDWFDVSVSDPEGNQIDAGDQPTTSTTDSTTTTDTPDGVQPFESNISTPHGDLDAPTWGTTFGGEDCDSYECWIGLTWNWAMLILVPLSVLILSAAGVIYMVSEGDSNRVALAKKMITGVASGVGLLVLSRVLLAIIGVDDKAWNIGETTLNIVRNIWFV
jgi:hypothetical protein